MLINTEQPTADINSPVGMPPLPPGTIPSAPQPGVAALVEPSVPSLAIPATPVAPTLATPTAKTSVAPPGSFASKMASAADKLGIPHGPGGWARSLVGAAQHALSGATEALGDAAAARELRPGEGGLAAIGSIRNAQVARQQAQQKAMTEEQKNQAAIAFTNVQKQHSLKLMHQMDDETIRQRIMDDKKDMADLMSLANETGVQIPIKNSNITEAQWQAGVANGTYNMTTDTHKLDGEIPSGKVDENGDSIPQLTYTIYTVPKEIPLTKNEVDKINKYIPSQNLSFDAKHPIMLPGSQAMALVHQANQAELLNINRESQLADINLKLSDNNQKIAANESEKNLSAHPVYSQAISQFPNDLQKVHLWMTGQYPLVDAKGNTVIDPKTGKPQIDTRSAAAYNAYPTGAEDMIRSYGGEKNFDAVVANQRKEAETERHDRAVEAKAAQDEKDKEADKSTYKGDYTLTGDAFLKTLNQKDANLVKLASDGKLPLNNPGYVLARNQNFLDAVAAYDPSFDGSRIGSYVKTFQDFTSGTTSKELVHGGVAAQHLQELSDLNTDMARIPGTPAYQKYENKVDTVASELAQFYGNNTIEGIASYKKTLDATFNRGAAIKTQVQSMHDRLNNYKTKWLNSAPSSAYEALQPQISPEAIYSMDYIIGGKAAADAAKALPVAKRSELEEGHATTFGNGQTWTLKGGIPVQIQTPQGVK